MHSLDTVDNSQINVLTQRTMHRICTAATNEEVSFAYRVAIPRQRFRWRNAFFYEMAKFIEIPVVITLLFSVLSRRNHYVRPRPQRFFDDPATVIASICQQILGRNSVDQGTSLCTISHGTCCDKKSDRHTMRIHGQMYFGVEPPFVRAMS